MVSEAHSKLEYLRAKINQPINIKQLQNPKMIDSSENKKETWVLRDYGGRWERLA